MADKNTTIAVGAAVALVGVALVLSRKPQEEPPVSLGEVTILSWNIPKQKIWVPQGYTVRANVAWKNTGDRSLAPRFALALKKQQGVSGWNEGGWVQAQELAPGKSGSVMVAMAIPQNWNGVPVSVRLDVGGIKAGVKEETGIYYVGGVSASSLDIYCAAMR
ncbi:MAG: hypothetical protein ABIH46_13000 [Chloroflexota bacterium]